MTTLDTLAMTRHIRDALYEQIKDLSPAERLAFYHRKAQAAHLALGITAQPIEPGEPNPATVPTIPDRQP